MESIVEESCDCKTWDGNGISLVGFLMEQLYGSKSKVAGMNLIHVQA